MTIGSVARSEPAEGAAKTLRLGLLGIGVGGAEILPAIDALPAIELVAGADLDPIVLQRFKQRYPGARGYGTAEELCADPEVDAIWVSTPNRFHAPHTVLAADHGKHVVVEKPMAVSLDEARQMVEAADRNGVKLLAGHTQSFSTPVRAMRKVIQSGELGQVCAINIWAYSDWLLRPRTADELNPAQGGGIPFRQGPHQIDTVRLLGGGLVRSVRAVTGRWMPERPIVGYYSALLELENGVSGSIVHNAYGYFLTNELLPWGHDIHRYTTEERIQIRKALRDGTRAEDDDKRDLRIGGNAEQQVFRQSQPKAWLPGDLGIVVVSCERGDIRHSADGLWVYGDDGRYEIPLGKVAGPVERQSELMELYDAVVHHQPVYHDGTWGLATLECCLALIQSAQERREITVRHQVAASSEYDADFALPVRVAP